jgi:hypothetical protein
MTQNLTKLQQEIKNYFEEHNYTLISPNFNEVTSKSQSLKVLCCCGSNKSKCYKDMLRRPCRGCKEQKLSEIPTSLDVIKNIIEEDPEDEWKPVVGGFISKKGRAANYFGKILFQDERGRYYLNGKLQYSSILMAEAFKVENSDKLNGIDSSYLVKNLNKQVKQITLEDIKVISRSEIGKENGQKSRQTDEFKEKMSMSLFQHMQKFQYKTHTQFPKYIFFEDGNIYNDNTGQGGKRFFTFSNNNDKNTKSYKSLLTKEKNYKVHKLICMIFHPIEGKSNYEDYNDIEPNHIDGNTQNNHASNLKWETKSENMQHAYDTGLNKKVRNVLQYSKNKDGSQGEFIKEHLSIASASRDSGDAEHRIRLNCQGKSALGDFIWKFKDESLTEEWSKKFTSRPKDNKKSIQVKPKKTIKEKVLSNEDFEDSEDSEIEV